MKNPRKFTRRGLLVALSTLSLALCLGACAGQSGTDATDAQDADATEQEASVDETVEPVEVHVASLKGPTSIGIAQFIGTADELDLTNTYTFTVATAADEILPAVIKGEVDIALIPANAAAVLYNKTEGGISVIDINTLGVLNVVTGNESVQTFADLAGRTVYLTGKGATPEYAMNFLLEKAGIADQVTLEFKSEATEVVAVLAENANAVGVLPQPFATAACVKNDALSAVIDLTDVWAASVDDGSQFLTGVTVVRNEFLAEHPEAVAEFVAQQAASVEAANADPAAAAPYVVAAGIIDAEPVAAKAIPGCHLVCIQGEEMQTALSGYLQTLFDSDPTSVGGSLPADDFYFLG